MLTFKQPPDFEDPADDNKNNVYVVGLLAYSGEFGLSFHTVTVTVTDIDEPPLISGPASVDYAEGGTGRVAIYTATGSENDPISWSVSGTDSDDFSINSTGELAFNAPPDFEAPANANTDNVCLVTVEASDGTNSDTVDVTVTVTDVNEPPEFPSTEDGARSVAENTATGQSIGNPVAATDPDTGETLTYSLGGDDAGSFSIDQASGQLQTKDPLDHETKSSYSVTVSVSDRKDADGNPDTATDATITVTVTVTNVNEPPEFPSSETGARSVAENTAAGQNIGNPVTATDPEDDTLTYSLDSDDAESFDIIPSTGQLQTKADLDYEDKASYSVTVSVSDSKDADGNPDTATDDTITVTVTVTNVNELPEFPSTEGGARSVAENTAAGQNIGDPVAATDPDTGETLTYSLGGGDAGFFDIIPSTGQLQTKADLDHETKSSYSVTVSASDSKDADGNPDTATDATITVTITVTNVNEPPEFPSSKTGARSVAENTAANTNIGDPVAATDPDTGETLTYSLGGGDAGSFDIIPSTGQLQTKADLDYEDKASYSITVSVSDGNPDTATDETITVTVTVTNEEESGIVDLSSVPPQVGTELETHLTDPDGDVKSITWTWERSTSRTGPWSAIGGATADSYTPVAADVDNYLRATASYTDGHGPDKRAQEVSTNAVQAAPVTNSAPEFAANTDARSVMENSETGLNVGNPVTATDPEDDKLTYTLGGDDVGPFRIAPASGQLQTKSDLDYEAKASYSVTVTATDPSDASDTITVTITVTNVEEAGTVALSLVHPQVDTSLTATLTDPDGNVSNTTWRWEKSADGLTLWTAISGATSDTYTPVAADVGNYLRATASFSDGEGSGKSAQVQCRPTQCRPRR